jgi:hypothetical protein
MEKLKMYACFARFAVSRARYAQPFDRSRSLLRRSWSKELGRRRIGVARCNVAHKFDRFFVRAGVFSPNYEIPIRPRGVTVMSIGSVAVNLARLRYSRIVS